MEVKSVSSNTVVGEGQESAENPPLFFIKPIDDQGQGIAGKERLEDQGMLSKICFKKKGSNFFGFPRVLVNYFGVVVSSCDRLVAVVEGLRSGPRGNPWRGRRLWILWQEIPFVSDDIIPVLLACR